MEDWADLKGAYRILGNARATHESLSSPHWARTRSFAGQPNLGVVLFIQDTTELDYSTHRDTSGLGSIGNGAGYGIELHSTLCVIPGEKAQSVGLAYQHPWVRDQPLRSQTEKGQDRRKRRTEHDVWKESIEAIGPAASRESGTTWLSVGDRGSDIFSYMSRARELGWESLVRSRFNRVLCPSEDGSEVGALHDLVRGLPSMSQTTLSLRTRPGVKSRVVKLNVAWTQARLPRPAFKGGQSTLAVNCIRVWEEPESDQTVQPLEWILLTSLPVQCSEEALAITGYYRHRWLIEEYHKCLKTGCRIEQRQVSTKHKLFALLGLLSIVAVYLLQFKAPEKGRSTPKEVAQAIRALTKTTEDLNDPYVLWRRIAMLGGFLGRKGDGEPGWQAIWSGWNRIQDILFGIQLAEELRCG
jgi:hypothetical protein